MKFKDMNLSDGVMRGLDALGFVEATEIQEKTMPLVASGVDVVGLSQTGSGKTYAYGIPAIEMIDVNLPATQVLVICPTRELVMQVVDSLKKLVMHDGRIRVTPIYGGANMDRQVIALKKGGRIVVGTPGRLMDHLRRNTLRLDYLKMLVLDEADEMLNMGFKQDIETILKSVKNERQTVMFSATMPPEIQKITSSFMKDAITIKSATHDCQHASIKQYYVNCTRPQKINMLKSIYDKLNPYISIVFCNTKSMTEDLADALKKNEMPVYSLHGDMRQRERTRTMEQFKRDGGMLIATDVAARGIDVKNVDIVVNYDFPNNDEYYTHRIGRTGRAGKEGTAITIINTLQQAKALNDLVKKVGGEVTEYAGLSTTEFLVDAPDKKRGKQRSGQSGQRRDKDRSQFGQGKERSQNRPQTQGGQRREKSKNNFGGKNKDGKTRDFKENEGFNAKDDRRFGNGQKNRDFDKRPRNDDKREFGNSREDKSFGEKSRGGKGRSFGESKGFGTRNEKRRDDRPRNSGNAGESRQGGSRQERGGLVWDDRPKSNFKIPNGKSKSRGKNR